MNKLKGKLNLKVEKELIKDIENIDISEENFISNEYKKQISEVYADKTNPISNNETLTKLQSHQDNFKDKISKINDCKFISYIIKISFSYFR